MISSSFSRIAAAFALIFSIISEPAFAGDGDKDNSSFILTPDAPDTPRINGARKYGARPGSDFLYRVPATGLRPMVFAAEGLPKGLKIDSGTGIISGSVKKEGTYKVLLSAENSHGCYEREFTIIIGDNLSLTPPLGWNSWNCWGNTVTQEKVMAAAKAMEEKGLADYGWSYINIDDGWQGVRGGKYNAIQPNRKFPDIKALADSIHAMGMKIGIYSGPWVATYAGHIGTHCDNPYGCYEWIEKKLHDENYKLNDPSGKYTRENQRRSGEFSFAEEDAAQWAEWGIDYLKYDWYPADYYSLKEMHDALEKTGRDIIYSISNGALFGLAPAFAEFAQCWRTTGDITDTWKSVSGIGFREQDRWAPYRSPGHWPDADMLVVGHVGWGEKTHPTRLTPDEQYSHITLWAMLASPMLLGCDMSKLDDFTISLLCNSEVIDIHQDVLGYQASKYYSDSGYATYMKPLEDGAVAVAMFNLSDSVRKIGFIPKHIGIIGTQKIRDVWRQKDIAEIDYRQRWETEVAPHGVVLVKVYPGNTKDKVVGYFRGR